MKYTSDELEEVLRLHKLWLNGDWMGQKADLSETDLGMIFLHEADLRKADLTGAYLRGANLYKADLRGADLSCADLTGANLYKANLAGVEVNECTCGYFPICPEKGSYIGYKKCRRNRIVELFIPEDALRSSATTRNCRASKAKVMSITSIDGTESFDEAVSTYDDEFIYRVGEMVEVPDFDADRWNLCGSGIHHFITREEAVLC